MAMGRNTSTGSYYLSLCRHVGYSKQVRLRHQGHEAQFSHRNDPNDSLDSYLIAKSALSMKDI